MQALLDGNYPHQYPVSESDAILFKLFSYRDIPSKEKLFASGLLVIVVFQMLVIIRNLCIFHDYDVSPENIICFRCCFLF